MYLTFDKKFVRFPHTKGMFERLGHATETVICNNSSTLISYSVERLLQDTFIRRVSYCINMLDSFDVLTDVISVLVQLQLRLM